MAISNHLTHTCFVVSIFQRMLYAQGSSKAPERYLHADGGVYRGEWKNGKKHGLGVYVYPNNARYEGRWVENVKQGLGTYYYPKVSKNYASGYWFHSQLEFDALGKNPCCFSFVISMKCVRGFSCCGTWKKHAGIFHLQTTCCYLKSTGYKGKFGGHLWLAGNSLLYLAV